MGRIWVTLWVSSEQCFVSSWRVGLPREVCCGAIAAVAHDGATASRLS